MLFFNILQNHHLSPYIRIFRDYYDNSSAEKQRNEAPGALGTDHTTAAHYSYFLSDPRNKITCGCFFIAEVLCQSVSLLLGYSPYFCLYTGSWCGLQDYVTKNRTVWLFPGDDNIPEIMPETLQFVDLLERLWRWPTRVTCWWQKCCCVVKQVLWNLFPAYYTWKVKTPDIRGLNIICWSRSVKFIQEMRF